MMVKSWLEEIKDAFIALGGDAKYSDLYEYIAEHRDISNLKDFKAQIRGTIEEYSSDSDVYKNKEDIFESIGGKGSGHWGLRNYEPSSTATVDLTEDDLGFSEGKKALYIHVKRERNASLVKKAKEAFIKEHGNLYCEICNFNYEDKYIYEVANAFVEAHHMKPISKLEENEKTKISDLVMVCSNCHRMVHRYKPFIENKKDLKKILKSKNRTYLETE